MKVGLALYSILDAAISSVDSRIYPELAPEGAAMPYIVYSVIGNSPMDTKKNTPVDEAQVEVFSVDDGYSECMALADAVRTALDRSDYQSVVPSLEIDVRSIQYTNEVTEVSADRKTYVAIQDYTIRIAR